MGEAKRKAALRDKVGISVDTFGGRVHVEWDPAGAIAPLGQLPFFIEFLKVSGLFESFVSECPLEYTSPNAPDKGDVLGTLFLSILSGHNRYAHIASVRHDTGHLQSTMQSLSLSGLTIHPGSYCPHFSGETAPMEQNLFLQSLNKGYCRTYPS